VRMPHVFLSYVREDAPIVDQLARTLISQGIDVWIDRQSIKPGERWDLAIVEAIRAGDSFIACFSRHSVTKARSGMNRELALAVEELTLRPFNRAWFIPVLLSPCEIPELSIGGNATLRSIQYVALYEHWQAGISRVLDTLSPGRPTLREPSREQRVREAIDLLGSSRQPGRGVPLVSAFGRDALPLLIEALTTGDSRKNRRTALFIECLGEIGSAAAEAVPTILDCSNESEGLDFTVYRALGRIGSALAVDALIEAFSRFRGTERGDRILLAIGDAGDAAGLPILMRELEQWRGDGRSILEILDSSGDTGDVVSALFPFRAVHALKLFGVGAATALKKLLNASDQIHRIRAICALASLDEDKSSEYEGLLVSSIKEGGEAAQEALCALRCFKHIETSGCLEELINASRSTNAGLAALAARVLVGNCTQSPKVSEAIRMWQSNNSCRNCYSLLPNDWRKSIWSEIYHWNSGS
jgi:hypothetical protein